MSIRGVGELRLFEVLVGLISWKWFFMTVSQGGVINSNNKNIVTKFRLPLWIYPSSIVIYSTYRFIFTSAILVPSYILISSERISFSNATNLLFVLALQIAVQTSTCFFLSLTIPIIPDLKKFLPNILMVLFFTSGIIFDIDNVPVEYQSILKFNPLLYVVESYRNILFQREPVESEIFLSYFFPTTIFLLLNLYIMKKYRGAYGRIS
jgi:lipopolysaccharide transport system permease protein